MYFGDNVTADQLTAILAPALEKAEGAAPDNSLTAAREEACTLAGEMLRTEPADLAGFLAKWLRMQERITETLPVLPVYTNVYFDFYTRELHNYRIAETVTLGEAVVESFMSDIELLPEEEKDKLEEALSEWK